MSMQHPRRENMMNAAKNLGKRLATSPHKSKIERYGWTLTGKPGEFQYVNKHDLSVDMEYQRNLADGKVRSITADFNWYAFGALLVAKRVDDQGDMVGLYLTDGGHRWSAAMRRDDIELVPCMIYEVDSIIQEAQAFLSQNDKRRPVDAIGKFKARIVTEDPVTLLVQSELDRYGYSITSSLTTGKTVKCIALLQKYAAADQETFLDVMRFTVEVADGGPIHERVFATLFYVESKLRKKEMSLMKQPWKSRVISLGSEGIRKAVGEAVSYFKEGGTRIWADGLVKALNRGLQKRLVLDDPSEESD